MAVTERQSSGSRRGTFFFLFPTMATCTSLPRQPTHYHTTTTTTKTLSLFFYFLFYGTVIACLFICSLPLNPPPVTCRTHSERFATSTVAVIRQQHHHKQHILHPTPPTHHHQSNTHHTSAIHSHKQTQLSQMNKESSFNVSPPRFYD